MEGGSDVCAAGQVEFRSGYALGDKVVLCRDANFACVVVAVRFPLGGTAEYLLRWRDCRGFTDVWANAGEIRALDALDE